MPRLGLWVFRSLQETYEAKRNEFLGELQKKEEEMRQMFVMRVKEKEAELKEAEKEVSCASSRSLKPEAGFLSALVINGTSHWCTVPSPSPLSQEQLPHQARDAGQIFSPLLADGKLRAMKLSAFYSRQG